MWILGLKGLTMTQRGYRRIYDCQEVEFSGFELCSYLKVSAFAVVRGSPCKTLLSSLPNSGWHGEWYPSLPFESRYGG